MKKTDVLKFFGGGSATAKALGLKRQAVHKWPDIVPLKRALQIESISKGKLKVKLSAYDDLR